MQMEHTSNKRRYHGTKATAFSLVSKYAFSKASFILVIVVSVYLYSPLLFPEEEWKLAKLTRLTETGHCPACLGVSACPLLYSKDFNFTGGKDFFNTIFGLSRIHFGRTRENITLVLKKRYLDPTFDSNLCKAWDLGPDCTPLDLLDRLSEEVIWNKTREMMQWDLNYRDLTPHKGLVFCPYTTGLQDFLQPVLRKTVMNRTDLINIWTMLRINPEPIILQALPRIAGWAVPEYRGACGRAHVVSYEGVPMSAFRDAHRDVKMVIASRVVDAAMDFTFKHKRFRFYIMDWSMDNIVVNSKHEVTFVDLDDVVVLDTRTRQNASRVPRHRDLPQWYVRHMTSFNMPGRVTPICRFYLADHNMREVCDLLVGGKNPFLTLDTKAAGQEQNTIDMLLHLLDTCRNSAADKFEVVARLQQYLWKYTNDLIITN